MYSNINIHQSMRHWALAIEQPGNRAPMEQPTRPIPTVPAPARARVTFSRTDPTDVGQRQIYVRLDDAPAHTLLAGGSCAEDVEPGVHRLRANNTLFWKRVMFAVAPGEQVEFVLINRAGAVAMGLLALLGVAPLSLVIERRTPSAAQTRLLAAEKRDEATRP